MIPSVALVDQKLVIPDNRSPDLESIFLDMDCSRRKSAKLLQNYSIVACSVMARNADTKTQIAGEKKTWLSTASILVGKAGFYSLVQGFSTGSQGLIIVSIQPVFMFCERLLCLADCHKLTNSTEDWHPEEIGDPNRFLGFFSSGRKLDLRLPSKYTKKKQWSLVLQKTETKATIDKKANPNNNNNAIVANGTVRTGVKVVPPPPPTRMSKIKSPNNSDSPDSSLSPPDSNQRSSSSEQLLVCDYQPLDEEPEDFLDYRLSEDDEENAIVSQFDSTHPNSVPLKASTPKSSKPSQENAKIIMNGGPDFKCKFHVDDIKVDTDTNLNLKKDVNANKVKTELTGIGVRKAIEDKYITEVLDEPDEDDDDEDDMNSEECNAIIDSVLKESPSEEEVSNLERKRQFGGSNDTLDSREVQGVKGCSSTNLLTSDVEVAKPLGTITDAILTDHYAMGENFVKRLRKYQRTINHRTTGWKKVAKEKDPVILSALLWSWLEQLKEPVLNMRDLSCIVIRSDRPLDILQRLDFGTRYTTEYLVRFVAQLRPKSIILRNELLKRILASLTHQKTLIRGTHHPSNTEWNTLRHGTSRELMLFVGMLYDMVTAELPT